MQIVPDIIQVVPHEDYTVSVYFADGKIVLYDAKPKINSGVFKVLQNPEFFKKRCKIMNDTLAWDISGNNDPSTCIDIAPETLYALEHVSEKDIA